MRAHRWIVSFAFAALALGAGLAGAFEQKKFDEAAFKAAQASGASILVHVTAPWCPTCTSQHKAIQSLSTKADLAKVAIFDVDFDSQKDALKSFGANSQSTLIAFKGDKETGRLVGATKADAIEGLIQSSLK